MLELKETTLGRYTIERQLAKGGMSIVYLATDQQTQQPVAIKVVNNIDTEEVKRFLREVKTLTRLQHEHILPILDYGAQDCWRYLVMPYIQQGTLRNRLGNGPLSLQEAGSILFQIAGALTFAHEQGILHRDIKPSNILLENGKYAYLADFGLAKDIVDSNTATLTLTGCLLGTPEYMAPELAEEAASIRSDVYALGIVLYQMLTTQTPFKGSTPIAIYWKQIKELPVPPSTLNPAISPAVEQVILRALEKDPEQRYPSALAMADAYEAALKQPAHATSNNLPTLAPPVQRIVPVSALASSRPALSRRALYAVGVAMLFLVAIPLWLGFSVFPGSGLRQTPNAISASLQWAGATYKTSEKPAQPRAQATPTAAPVLHTTWSPPPTNSSTSSGSDHGRSHGHKHGHKHGG